MKKVALICQPIDALLPPKQSSLGIWAFEIATRLTYNYQVTVYARKNSWGACGTFLWQHCLIYSVPFRIWNKALSSLFSLFHKKYYFSHWLYCIDYSIQVLFHLKKTQPDIIHIMNFSQIIPFIRYAVPSAKVILHMHCEWLTQIDSETTAKRLRKTNLVLSCSDYITSKTRNTFPRIHAKTLYNGVCSKKFFPKERSYDNPTRILFVGRCSPEKGVHLLIDAFGILSSRFPKLNLTVIGFQGAASKDFILPSRSKVNSPLLKYFPNYFDNLQKKIPSTLLKRIQFLGPLPQSQLTQHYQESDIFVFPSIWAEPFGMPIIESMACGLPVIASNCGGIPEIIQHGENGWLVEPNNHLKLAESISYLLQNKEIRKKISQNGQKHISQYFTWDKISNSLKQSWEELF